MKSAAACAWLLVGGLFVTATPAAQPPPSGENFRYTVVPGDTLIAISQRWLRDPELWPQLQQLNQIRNPRRIPPATFVMIPYEWLRIVPQPFTVEVAVGDVTLDGARVATGQTGNAPGSLKTGANGFVVVRLADGSRLRMRANSEMRLEMLDRLEGDGSLNTRVRLQSGKVETEAAQQGEGSRFEVRSPLAITAVRGTSFRVGMDGQGAFGTSEVLTGAVAVGTTAGGVDVGAGFGTRVDPGSAPQAPVRLLDSPDLSPTPTASATPELLWVANPVPGAVSYFVELTQGGGSQEIISSTVVPAPQGAFPALANGQYELRVAAIDRLGLEGAAANLAITRRRVAQLPDLSPAVRIVGTDFGFRCVVPAGARCDWQMSIHPDFHEISRTGVSAEPVVTLSRLLPGRYYLRARNVDRDGVISEYSPSQELRQSLRAWIGAKINPAAQGAPP